ncbi:tRNA-guanine transglycosylase [Methanofollis formosanus]|nr:tRNA-guanine transglycosylase [Methanofollis formosanus]
MTSMTNIRIIDTATRELETPAFFPVHNGGKGGEGNTPRYWEMIPDMNTMMINAYSIYSSPLYEKMGEGGLHDKYSNNGVFFVDSGGFQQKNHDLTLDPIEMLRVQENVGADIAATLDLPVFAKDCIYNQKYSDAVKISVKNALIALDNREREDMLIYASLQGNDPIMMMNTIDYLKKRGNFDGFAIGGCISKRSDYHAIIDIIHAVRKRIGDLPLHVFGLGGPTMIPLMVYMGADTFDSSAFLKAGSKRLYYMPGNGSIEFSDIPETTYLPCTCPICSIHPYEEVRSERKLIGMHNLWMITHEIRKLKMAIEENEVEQYLEKRFMNSPAMYEAFRYAKAKKRGLV